LDTAIPGDRVVIWAPNSLQWLIAMYACAFAGLVLVPFNPNLVDEEVVDLIECIRPALVLSVAEYRGSRLLDRAGKVAEKSNHSITVADLEVLGPTAAGLSAALPRVAPTDPFLIQPTSGTTGRPKCALHGHRGLMNCAGLASSTIDQGPGDVWLSPVPYYHVGGSVAIALGALAIGAGLVIVPAFDPPAVAELIAATRPTLFSGVPTMLFDMLQQPGFRKESMDRLRVVLGGGSVVPPSMVRQVEDTLGVRSVIGYGQSEAPCISITSLDDSDVVKAETIGRPLPHREVRIVSESGDTVGLGEVGELCTRSPMVMDGYVGMPEETARVLDGEGWLHTGDLCSIGKDGVIRFHGRRRDLIIRGGQNVYPDEVEHVLLRHPAVGQVAVVGVPDERWGEQVAAVVVPTSKGAGVDAEELEAYARRFLASYKVPFRWKTVSSLPLTYSGKVKKFEVRQSLIASSEG
jgi:fatty-acyl-CoA synthase